MLTVNEALEAVLSHVAPGNRSLSPLAESLDRVLAEDLRIPHDSPPFDKSTMDGFGVRGSDFQGSEFQGNFRQLTIVETVTAGGVPSVVVQPGMTARIMTGALIPEGVDCVVPVEQVTNENMLPDSVIVPADAVLPGRNILRQGATARIGEPLMLSGTLLEPQHLAALAEFGVAQVEVYQPASVAILATGDELLTIDQPLSPGRIRNSNEPMLTAQVRRAQAIPMPLGIARDDREELKRHISAGLRHDFLILSGGVSAGTLDLVPTELREAGVTQVFHRINMKPGKPLWFGCLKTPDHVCYVFGLPGNPVSSMICFELFVRPALRVFGGWKEPRPISVLATLTQEVRVMGDRPTYHPCRLKLTDHGLAATPVDWGGSADLRSTSTANGMCLLAVKPEPYFVGQRVPAISWS